MANFALNDQLHRKVEVKRELLLETLEANLKKHLKDYELAMSGYKNAALFAIQEGYGKAVAELKERHTKAVESLNSFDVNAPGESPRHYSLIHNVVVDVPYPVSYASAYEAAIDMFKWDVRETITLTFAEFTTFVRDKWDWKPDFERVAKSYSIAR